MTHESDEVRPQDARDALRTVWEAQGDPAEALDDDCSPTKVCKNMKGVSFDGWAEPGSDLRSAWRDRLAREGKLNTGGGSIRDLVLGNGESR
jgi:hypothetical protein